MKPELLSPVSDFISLQAAIEAGADSVYFGVKEFNMRANAKNFTLAELKKAVKLCHDSKVKAYLTLNTIIYESELTKVKKVILAAKKAGIDAIICWDMAIIKECNKNKIPVHLSTQASVSNSEAAEYYMKKHSIKRIILARETSLDEIKKIKKALPELEVETFIHGAMCVSVSGRCFMSQEIFGRSANRGDCLQPCRRSYIVKDSEEKHKLRVKNNYVMSPKDLCTLPFLDKLKAAGIDCFKIEGRNRSPEYVKAVTAVYRQAIDTKLTESNKKSLMKELKAVYNRGFSSGFFMRRPIAEWCGVYGSKATKKKTYIGAVKNFFKKPMAAEIKIESHQLKIGDTIMVQGPTTGVKEQTITEMQVHSKAIVKAAKGSSIAIKLNFLARQNDKVYLIY